jgi:hypothetical protein
MWANAAILLFCTNHELTLPLTPRPWWEIFLGRNRKDDLSTVCNAILAVGDISDVDSRRAKYVYVPSLMKDGSLFNDPESYLWSTVKD